MPPAPVNRSAGWSERREGLKGCTLHVARGTTTWRGAAALRPDRQREQRREGARREAVSRNERSAPAAMRPITEARVLCLWLSYKGGTPLLRAIHHRKIMVASRCQFVTRASRSLASISKKVSPL